jgi:hypothetical protein
MPVNEAIIWSELVPFLAMKETDAATALAEYVVFKERPTEARVAWLKRLINSALRACHDDSLVAAAELGLVNEVAWCALLDADTISAIDHAKDRSMHQK